VVGNGESPPSDHLAEAPTRHRRATAAALALTVLAGWGGRAVGAGSHLSGAATVTKTANR
jgi:hypothetical protein